MQGTRSSIVDGLCVGYPWQRAVRAAADGAHQRWRRAVIDGQLREGADAGGAHAVSRIHPCLVAERLRHEQSLT
jgi:hypothetical protein